MRFHSLQANVQQLCDLLIRITFGNQLNDSTLPVGENQARARVPREEGVQERSGYAIGKVRLVAYQSLHGFDDVLVCIQFSGESRERQRSEAVRLKARCRAS